MKANLVITLDGQISIITQEGTFADGKERLEKLLALLEADGLDIDLNGPIEQHRHGPNGEHVHTHAHNQAKA